MKALFLALLISLPVFADCAKNVQKVSLGTPASCEGWHVSPPQMLKFDKAMDLQEVNEKLIAEHKELGRITEAELEYYKKRVKSQSEELDKAETRRFLSTAGAFALGVILTGIAAKAAIESAK